MATQADRRSGWERWAYASLWLVMLAPALAQALAQPLARGLAQPMHAPTLTLASALVTATIALVGRRARRRSPQRDAALLVGAALAGTLLLAASGSSAPISAAVLLAIATATRLASPRVIAALPARLDGLARAHRGATAGMIALGLAALLQTAALATFMGDPTWVAGASPVVPQMRVHACSTAYMRAIELALAGVDNLYAAELWPSLDHGAGEADAALDRYAPFGLDAYAYPPTFLVLVRPFSALADFASQRALWFGCNALALALGLGLVARWIGEHDALAGTRASLLALVVWATPTAALTLQVGNVHLTVLAAAVVAMVWFERGRMALGGALLAAAILTKISPGLLGVVLLVRGQVRAALWTAGFGLAWLVLALVMFGPAPFEAFVGYELPRLSSGEALAFFAETPTDTLVNLAPFGLPFKLALLGVGFDDPWASAQTIAALFNLVVLGLTIVAGLRSRGDRPAWYRVCLWLAVLTLGGLRSPFAPTYVALGLIWLLCCSAHERRGWRGWLWFALLVLGTLGPPLIPGTATTIAALAQQALVLALVVHAIVRPGAAPISQAAGRGARKGP